MAGQFVQLVLDGAHNLESGAKLTLVALAEYANVHHHGQCWPSVASLSFRVNLCERQVRENLRSIERAGWVRRLGTGLGGRGQSTCYQLNLEALTAEAKHRKAEFKRRVSDAKGGSAVPGIKGCTAGANPAVNGLNPEVEPDKPGSLAPERGRSTAPEQEVEPEVIEQEVEQDAPSASRGASNSSTPIHKSQSKPEQENTAGKRAAKTMEEIEVERQRQLAALKALVAKGKNGSDLEALDKALADSEKR